MFRILKMYIYMSDFISSATVIFVPKSVGEERLSSVTISIGPQFGCTIPHAVGFLYKNPIIKFNLRESNILSITFNYSKI